MNICVYARNMYSWIWMSACITVGIIVSVLARLKHVNKYPVSNILSTIEMKDNHVWAYKLQCIQKTRWDSTMSVKIMNYHIRDKI